MDEALSWLGFETRHVYILYPETPRTGRPIPYWRSLITRRTPSHAATEVKTQRGWLLVDSLEPWISDTAAGEPVAADQIAERLGEFREVPPHLKKRFLTIRGL